jgi:hypothetical protein
VHNVQPTRYIKVEAEKQDNVVLWVTLCNAHSKNRGMGLWHARDLGVNQVSGEA